MSKKPKQYSKQIDWEISKTNAKLAERKRTIKTLKKYNKQDKQKLKELENSIDSKV